MKSIVPLVVCLFSTLHYQTFYFLLLVHLQKVSSLCVGTLIVLETGEGMLTNVFTCSCQFQWKVRFIVGMHNMLALASFPGLSRFRVY